MDNLTQRTEADNAYSRLLAIEFLKWSYERAYTIGFCDHRSRVVAQDPDFKFFSVYNEEGELVFGRGVYLTAEELYDYWFKNR